MRRSLAPFAVLVLTVLVPTVLVLTGCHIGRPAPGEPGETISPYVGEVDRSIKALSADRIRGLLAGEGLGYAMAAELNGYPGPRHVLDLGDSLGLTPEQRRRVEEVFREMRDDARSAGHELVRTEARLDSIFAARQASDDEVRMLTAEAARLEGQVRYAHLAAHLRTAEVLTPEQVMEYVRLRGYEDRMHEHGDSQDHG